MTRYTENRDVSCQRRAIKLLVYIVFALGRFAYGYLFGLVLWFLLVRPYLSLFNAWSNYYLPEFIFSTCVASVFMVSILARELMILFLPSMAGSASQNYVLLLLFTSLAVNPISHIATNAVESTRVVGCTLTLSYEHLRDRAKLLFNPIIEVLSDKNQTDLTPVKEDLLHIQRVVADMRHEAEFGRLLDEVEDKKNRMPHSYPSDEMISADLGKITQVDTKFGSEVVQKTKKLIHETRVELDKDKLGLKASMNVDDIYQLLSTNTSSSLGKFNLTQIMRENCFGVFRQAKKSCQEAIENMRQSCQDVMGTVFAFVLCSPVKFTVSSLCPWVLDQIVDESSVCNQIQETTSKLRLDPLNGTSGGDIDTVYRNLSQQLVNLGGDLFESANLTVGADLNPHTPRRLEINISFNEELKKVFRTGQNFWLFISDKYKWRKLFYDILTLFYELYTTYTFISIINHARVYRKAYLSDLKYDNNYVTGQFIALDRYRRDLGKRAVLPLTDDESKRYIPTLTCERRTSEEQQTQRASCIMIVVFLVFVFALLYFDNIFYSILLFIREHSLIKFRDFGHHEVDLKVDGEGSVARLIRQLTSRLNSVYTLDKTTTTQDCLPNPVVTSGKFYLQFAFFVTIYITIDQVSIYAMRFRRLTMAFFNPEIERQRIHYLYRKILKTRRRIEQSGAEQYLDDPERNQSDHNDDSTLTLRDAAMYLGDCIISGLRCRRSQPT